MLFIFFEINNGSWTLNQPKALSKSQNWQAGPVVFQMKLTFGESFCWKPSPLRTLDFSGGIVLIKTENLITTKIAWPVCFD